LKGIIKIIYIYNFQGEQYNSIGDYQEGVKCNNGRYFVKFSSNSPENSKILFNYPVPDSIKEAPILGWDEWPLDKNIRP